ncbi:DNA-binding NarL/FixJ family response regulator [Anaerosolibacter carboniphilus]|uniref:Stage 0 sporulation protein A homolog n=1 Tax=Anaerosolibacter carboniphilus TaxID=1417629 RepID=A0A841L1Y1_9FIRM|nr:response regulator transcription factor [Anaerosolibacter carboniphilus]MBB6217172.1 DNA-binding NarL/FixJ family response regulator [Anaerosolibacter carboniphilus]
MEKIKVMIVDDQIILSQGLKMILGMETDLEVIAVAANGQEAISHCHWQCPDIILMDIKMPIMNGVDATEAIKSQFTHPKIIVLTTFHDTEYIFNALKKGASGYILKESPPEDIIHAIRTVHQGGSILQPNIATKVIEEFTRMASQTKTSPKDDRIHLLSDREKDIIQCIGAGMNNKEIADHLFLSEGTVRNHISHMLEKLNLRDRTQLAIFAIKNQLT